jgi:hypothetical protein
MGKRQRQAGVVDLSFDNQEPFCYFRIDIYLFRKEKVMEQEYYKKDEIKDHFDDFLAECDKEWIDENIDDLHHHAFNMDYFIIGYARAEHWLGNQVFNVIETIRDYEESNFGEVNTDFSSSEKVVNMYAYIVGEEVVQEWLEERGVSNE